MQITISETNGVYFEDSVLRDLGRFKDLKSWLTAIKNKDVTFYPMDCAVMIDGKLQYVVYGHQVTEDVDKIIKNPVVKCCYFPNDDTEIDIDSFEGELFFYPNGRTK